MLRIVCSGIMICPTAFFRHSDRSSIRRRIGTRAKHGAMQTTIAAQVTTETVSVSGINHTNGAMRSVSVKTVIAMTVLSQWKRDVVVFLSEDMRAAFFSVYDRGVSQDTTIKLAHIFRTCKSCGCSPTRCLSKGNGGGRCVLSRNGHVYVVSWPNRRSMPECRRNIRVAPAPMSRIRPGQGGP